MENIGVAVGIVVDNTAENITQVLMSDDGTGGGIRIPSMLIGSADGKKLMDWMKTATEEEKTSMAIMCEFVMPYNEDDTVSYDFWLTSSNDRALDFLEDFAGMDAVLGKNAIFTPHYVFWECPNCDERYVQQDCFGGGKYCAVEPSNMSIKGQEIIMEDLRQKCLWTNLSAKGDHSKWWQYIQKVHSECFSVINEDCSQRAHTKLGLSWEETNTCIADSFNCPQDKWASKLCANEII